MLISLRCPVVIQIFGVNVMALYMMQIKYTREAIKAFQRKVGLIPDGVAGARTKSEMKSYTGC